MAKNLRRAKPIETETELLSELQVSKLPDIVKDPGAQVRLIQLAPDLSPELVANLLKAVPELSKVFNNLINSVENVGNSLEQTNRAGGGGGQIRREVSPSVAQGSSQEQSSSAYAVRGASYWDLGEYRKAIADCDKAIQLDPNSSFAYAVRGDSYRLLGEYQKAIADCDKAIQLDPNDSFAYARRGASYWLLGEYQKAIADCDKAIQLDPNDSFAYARRGTSYWKLGEYQKAIGDWVTWLSK
jgi:tetratricopeptide (TPR) repeat protein